MYCNLTKSHALPLPTIKPSPHHRPICSKLRFFSIGSGPKPSQNPNHNLSNSHFGARKVVFRGVVSIGIAGGFGDSQMRKVRSFSDLCGGNGNLRRRLLPWLEEGMVEECGKKRVKEGMIVRAGGSSSSSLLSWEEAAKKFVERSGLSLAEEEDEGMRIRDTSRTLDDKVKKKDKYVKKRDERDDDEAGDEDDVEEVEDPQWYNKIRRNKVEGVVSVKPGFRKPESSRTWSSNRQESWGRKTFKETTTESSVPKMVGEGVYGVGPVLAALSAGRREFYTLYVQQGLDLSGNNRKKKDKKGFEKVLKLADKAGLSVKEVSKHDLNMVVDSRPHQGLILDASPLEMVNIRELDPVSGDGDQGLLWMALDEVTDPQNLGAIVRSAYFFGATGVVLCAKNSAPLSGVVSKASAGSLELMEVRSCKNMMQFLTSSAENGWRVIGGSVSSRASPLHEVSPGPPTIIVLGSEGTGLRPLVERSCTQLVRIPGNFPVDVAAGRIGDAEVADLDHEQSGEDFRSFLAVESLNVSVAAGVLLHYLIGNKSNNITPIGVVDEGGY